VEEETSSYQTRKDKRRIKTIFNHFRDKPARATEEKLSNIEKLTQELKKETV
jgi:hypothetical protein